MDAAALSYMPIYTAPYRTRLLPQPQCAYMPIYTAPYRAATTSDLVTHACSLPRELEVVSCLLFPAVTKFIFNISHDKGTSRQNPWQPATRPRVTLVFTESTECSKASPPRIPGGASTQIFL